MTGDRMTKLDELIAALEKAIQDYKDARDKSAEKWYAVWRLGDAADQLSWSGPYTKYEYAKDTFPEAMIVDLTDWPL